MTTTNPPAPLAQLRLNIPITSPNGTLALLNSAGQVAAIGANPVRRGIIFINPATNTAKITIVPANQTAVSGQGEVLLPGAKVAYVSNPNTNETYNCGWNAICDTGSNVPLQILELL